MIESSISWTIGLTLSCLLFYMKTPFFLLLILIDGFLNNFTKYHVGFFLSGLLLFIFGLVNFMFVKFCILSFLFIKNFSYISKKYVSGKKCLHAMLKLTKMTGMKSDELDIMEYIDNKTTYVDNKVKYLNELYTETKNNIISKINEVSESELLKDVKYGISITDHAIEEIVYFGKQNLLLVGEIFYSIPYLKSYLDKGNKYISIGNDMFIKYENDNLFGEQIVTSKDHATINNQTEDIPTEMNIDMEKLGDLAGLMTGFLDSIGEMNLNVNEKNNDFLIHQNFQMPFDFTNLTNSMIIDDSKKRIDEDVDDITPLDDELEENVFNIKENSDEVLSDDDIHELLTRGGKINEKHFSHALKSIEKITTEKDNTKISLKKKKF